MTKKLAEWHSLSCQDVYDNPWIRVSHREVTAPTGAAGIYGLVHFKNCAIGVVPIDADGNTWLVGQQRYTLGEYSWEIPEGGAPAGESPLHAAMRELREETGIIATRWTRLMTLHTSNSVTDEVAQAFVAQDLSFTTTEPDPSEDLAVKKLPLDDAVSMVLDGEITDALSMASLMKVQLLLAKNIIQCR